MNPSNFSASRRRWLAAAAGASALAAPRAWAQALPRAHGDGRLVVVFLRGALDGLSAFIPYADREYARLRPGIAIAAPDGTAQTALKLDDRFALHPAFAPLLPLWQSGALAVVPAAGSPDATRSHFDAQYQWETARPGQSGDAPGWLNRLAAQLGAPDAGARVIGVADRTPRLIGVADRTPRLIGVGEANPRLLAGAQPVRLVAHGPAAARAGALDNPRQREALMALYGGDDAMADAFRRGVAARLQTARELASDMREQQAANNGAAPPARLVQDAQNLATLMRKEPALRLGFLSAGGWDTHVGQGNVTGGLANNLARLAEALALLQRHFDQPGDMIVVASEFGRTARENGTGGTDHGHGNAMWVIGRRVAGGRAHGDWTGLAQANLHEGRDTPVHHDFRAVLAQLLRPAFSLTDRQLQDVLPGARWDARLEGLVRPA